MEQDIKSLDIEVCDLSQGDCLNFIFVGEFKEKDALEAIEEWKSMFKDLEGTKVSLVWDCLNMTGFENGARVAWQKAMKEMRDQIDTVWLITTSSIIKAGAKLISTFTKFKIKVVKTREEVMVHKMVSRN
jgi:hypothetical protein